MTERKIVTIIILVLSNFVCFAQLADNIKKHMIIAIDRYPEKGRRYQNTLEENPQLLFNSILKLSNKIDMSNEDFFSLVIFSIGTNDSSLDKYATCGVFNEKQLLWANYNSFSEVLSNLDDWKSIINSHTNEGLPFSMLTGSLMYSFKACNNNGKFANQTYLLMVTDNQYNGGGDMDAEFVHFMQMGASQRLKREEFRNTCISIAKDFNFVYICDETIMYDNMYPYKVTLFEVRPSSSFSLNSVVNYPANLGLRRIKGGYKVSFEFQLTSKEYELLRFDLVLHHASGVSEETTTCYNGNTIEANIKSSDLNSDSIKITLKGWLHKINNNYNCAILNPNDSAFANLSIIQILPLKDEYKIFGMLPLTDAFWWWYPDNLHKAVLVWEAILLPILILLVLSLGYYLLLKATKYVPKDSDIKLTHL